MRTFAYNKGTKLFKNEVRTMAKSANLYARIEPDLKEQAEWILSALGFPPQMPSLCFISKSCFRKDRSEAGKADQGAARKDLSDAGGRKARRVSGK